MRTPGELIRGAELRAPACPGADVPDKVGRPGVTGATRRPVSRTPELCFLRFTAARAGPGRAGRRGADVKESSLKSNGRLSKNGEEEEEEEEEEDKKIFTIFSKLKEGGKAFKGGGRSSKL